MNLTEQFQAFINDIPDLKKTGSPSKTKIWITQLTHFLEQFDFSQIDLQQLNDLISRLESGWDGAYNYDNVEFFLNLLMRKGLYSKAKPSALVTALTAMQATPITTVKATPLRPLESSIPGMPDTVSRRMMAEREKSRRDPAQVESISVTQKANSNQITKRNKIFIVHGHDDTSKLELARILEKMGLDPIILHEQPNQGRTIMEKFEEYSKDVNFAFVLLTPDDIGGTDKSDLKKRARQNVILELGFFTAQLGRSKVCCLHKSEVELPTDYLGVTYLPFVNSPKECYEEIIRELKSVGFELKL